MYKHKNQKLLPVKQPLPNSINPSGIVVPDPGSGWVEARAIPEVSSFYVSKFLYEELVCHYGCPRRIVLNGRRENLDLMKDLLQHY